MTRMRMRRPFITVLFCITACAERTPLAPDDGDGSWNGAVNESGTRPIKSSAPFVGGEIVVKTSPGMDLPTLNAKWGTQTILELEHGAALLAAPPGVSVVILCAEMCQSGDCSVAQPNWNAESPESVQGVMPFYEGDAVPGDVGDQDAMRRIRACEAHRVARGSGITVAIVDTGIDASHPDLQASVSPIGWDFIDDDADPTDVADGIDQDQDGTIDEAAGHGTHVAGLVHAGAPGATLMAVRVLDSEGIGNSVAVACGIRFAALNGAQVINLSLGMYEDADVIKDAIRDAVDQGVVAVCAAGNRGTYDRDHFPSRLYQAISVAATDPEDFKADFSNFGPFIELSAPGVGILSTFLHHGYARWSGTSMAAPLVSAAAALRLEVRPGSSPYQVCDALENGAFQPDYQGLDYEGKMGDGRVDLLGVVD